MAPVAATAQQPAGWTGSIAVVYTWSGANENGSTSHREEAQYVFDGGIEPGGAAGPLRWDHSTSWDATFNETKFQTDGCPGPSPFTSTADGSGQGSGRGVLQFAQFGQDPDWQYNISAASTSDPFTVTVVPSCGGGVTFSQNAFPADNAFDSVWSRLPAGQTPEQTTELSGQREFTNVTFQGDHITVSWSLSREPDPPECSNGRDDDLDGFIDFAGGVPGLRDPGCQSNEDDSEAHGTIIIDKLTRPNPVPDAFGFTGPLGAFTLADASEPYRIDVEPGTHLISEDLPLSDWRLVEISCTDSATTVDLAAQSASLQVEAGETVRCEFVNRLGPLTIDLTARYRYLGFVRRPLALANGFDIGRVDGEGDALARVAEICVHSWWVARAHLGRPTSTPMFWNGEPGPFANPNMTLVSRTPPRPNGLYRGHTRDRVRISSCGPPRRVRQDNSLVVTSPGKMTSFTHFNVVEVFGPGRVLLGSVRTRRGAVSRTFHTERDTQTVRIPLD